METGKLNSYHFRQVKAQDLQRCYDIESSAYEGDEAATREKIALRIDQYPQGFLVMEQAGKIVGFINSGCAHEVTMSDHEFKELIGHDPLSLNVVIMSVVVAPEHQGKGLATMLMHQFVQQTRDMGKKTIHLMCKERHVKLYGQLGFRYVRLSDSEHGGMAWHEMMMDL
ncbi:GNAT family N-acetyltransferase [Solimicrobium silvestre]|uniref:Acetyltransferase (GNAT) family n=1 Tax=Solimicrobium silvestre TaxID=2099400 RepID=A0A2S9GVU7_9BURK|nr:GNAT family N-acetyltransferase [Solimicrobium silvestre]PRC91847.1 Acetyltransferase (GNAT) family [Solimicrobium silvestre]